MNSKFTPRIVSSQRSERWFGDNIMNNVTKLGNPGVHDAVLFLKAEQVLVKNLIFTTCSRKCQSGRETEIFSLLIVPNQWVTNVLSLGWFEMRAHLISLSKLHPLCVWLRGTSPPYVVSFLRFAMQGKAARWQVLVQTSCESVGRCAADDELTVLLLPRLLKLQQGQTPLPMGLPRYPWASSATPGPRKTGLVTAATQTRRHRNLSTADKTSQNIYQVIH